MFRTARLPTLTFTASVAGSLLSFGLLTEVPCVPLRYHHPLEGRSGQHRAGSAPIDSSPPVELSSLTLRWRVDGAGFKPGDLSDLSKQTKVKAWVSLTDRIIESMESRPVAEQSEWAQSLRACAEHPSLIDTVRAICWKRWLATSDGTLSAASQPQVPSRVAALSEII